LTAAMVEQAEATRLKKGLSNVCFQEGDAKSLTFPNSSFDIVTCGSAFHHFAYPNRVLAEMIRVTKQGGKVALIDIITSENTEHAALHNQLEQLRDPSHTRNFPLTELVALFEKAGLHDVRTATYATLRELDEWLAISRTSGALAKRIRRAFIASIPDDATGLNVHCEGDRICFTHTFAWVLGKRA
ncbi:methyltransferase domain-containing protein, partial [Candidatus Bathyarchaeota archaeon]|nr:methyltransferase domain-containing protein [Candidatus Bathyarchaeota archaeon]